ncbi:MAG TPA: isoprenylcysteine carboxylmethyltransferase family protein [Chloroflexota bacterium]|nr:isoprenylcysteine carboxylmethyltransferase family protein [Chloroflexota bacterium]
MSLSRDFVIAAFGYWVAVELWVIVRELGRVDRSQDRGSRFAAFVSIAVAVTVAGRIAKATAFLLPGGTDLHLNVAAVVVLAGSSLRLWSIHTLGRFFRSAVMIQAGHRVVRSGPYRFVRHPSYSAIILNLLGVGVALGNWLALLAIIALGSAGLALRIKVEEQALAQGLGDEYVRYLRETKRVIPFLL